MQQEKLSTDQDAEAGAEVSSTLRALAVVATRLGLDINVDQLRRRFALQPGEPDTATFIAVARELGLEAEALQMTFQDLPRLREVHICFDRSLAPRACSLDVAGRACRASTLIIPPIR